MQEAQRGCNSAWKLDEQMWGASNCTLQGKTKAMGKMLYFATEPKNIKMMFI